MKRYLVLALASLGFATAANAQTPGPEDIQAIVDNLGPTVDALADGLGDTANTLISTQSAVQTSAALGDTAVNTGNALINGSPNLGTLGLLFAGGNNAIQQTLNPALTAIDDPSAANIQAALAPEDLNTIAENLEEVPFAAIEGSGPSSFAPNGTGLRAAGIELLKGNLGDIGSGAAIYGVGGVVIPVQTLVDGTNYQPLSNLAALGGLGLLIAGQPVIEQLDGPASQLAAAGAPLTEPVIGTLEAGF